MIAVWARPKEISSDSVNPFNDTLGKFENLHPVCWRVEKAEFTRVSQAPNERILDFHEDNRDLTLN